MSWLAKLGAAIGREAAESINYGEIMAKEFERLATLPKYAHCADELRQMAVRARATVSNGER